jgi:hypothetical protein
MFVNENMKVGLLVNRREFLGGVSALFAGGLRAAAVYVSPRGDDDAAGSLGAPVRTIERAFDLARGRGQIVLRGGTYELEQTLRITQGPLRMRAYAGEAVVLSGGTRLSLEWKAYRHGIFVAAVPAGTRTDQLFVNGRRQVLARYPNFNADARYLGGTAADAFSPERVKHWADPAGGFIHGLQNSLWGSLHYAIKGKAADGTLEYEGGWQIDRDQPLHPEYRFVEGVFEELDAPGEWFLDEAKGLLYFYPPAGMDLPRAEVAVVRLEGLLELKGARWIELEGITFRHTLRTFMKTREPLLRSDWRIYRGGAIVMEGCEDVRVEGCTFDQVGGNAVFVSGHNRRVGIRGCRITEAGASGVCFVGRPESARNALETYAAELTVAELDRTPGPRGSAYPADCLVEDCLIDETGRVEKQTAGVEIAMARDITVRHCSIYGVPRAGINIGDGDWGGHLVEGCDVFNTVLETSDHGAFNSWGRDRWWNVKGADEDTLLEGALKDLPTLDAVEANTLRGNRWACEHGWDIDLDDGSSHYQIEGNLCLSGGLKLREGFFRTCENNILVNNTLHVHVWPKDSRDVFRRNIVFVPYRPVRPRGWGAEFDFNLLHHAGMLAATPADALAALSGGDAHSLEGDARFVDPALGDYGLREGSPALALGFRNIAMGRFGVRSARLRDVAKVPEFARLLRIEPATLRVVRRKAATVWMGARVRNLVGLTEVSALGAPGEIGVVVDGVEDGSAAALAGLRKTDLILGADGRGIISVDALLAETTNWKAGHAVALEILREQQRRTLTLVVVR